VRCHGLVESPGRVGADGHACWAYDDLEGDFLAAAAAFLHEGVALDQALMFVGGAQAEEVVRSVDPLCRMVADGTLQIASFDEVYPGGQRRPHAEQWATYAGATEQARQRGHTGLRVLAEVTALARDDGSWLGQARWESYAESRMPGTTLSALCCFDRAQVPPEGIAAIASAHPIVDSRLADLVPFRLFGSADAIRLAGEIDAFSSSTLRHLLRSREEAGDLVLHLGELTFIEHTGVQALVEYADSVRAKGQGLTVRDAPASLLRIADVLRVSL
jgi:anti-anti-sigma factor